MLLSISLQASPHGPPPERLSFLLHKHPDRCQSFALPFGQAHVFYPEASPSRYTMSLLLDIDPLALSRRSWHGAPSQHLLPHVNDRPYVCSSFMSVALNRVLRTALAGRCKRYPKLPLTPLSGLEVTLYNLPVKSRSSEENQHELLHRLFSPLGYTCQLLSSRDETQTLLDPRHPDWGHSSLLDLRLTHPHICLKDLLTHLYVLIPVLDDQKHYFIDQDEVDKLARHGQEWLANHPDSAWITARYLKRQRKLVRRALSLLDEHVIEQDEQDEQDETPEPPTPEVTSPETPPRKPLHERRLHHVLELLLSLPEHHTVLDMGCGEGKMLALLSGEKSVEKIIGVDVSTLTLERAKKRLKFSDLPPRVRERLTLEQGSLLYSSHTLREARVDVALLVEVIEHIEPEHLELAMHNMLGYCQPRHLIVTTPNVEYNALFETLPADRMRHHDHRFEWDRHTFQQWATTHSARYGYTVRFEDVGDLHDTLGAQTQLAIFSFTDPSTTSP